MTGTFGRAKWACAALAAVAGLAMATRASAAPFEATAVRVGLERNGNTFTSYIVGTATQLGAFEGASAITVHRYTAAGPVTLTGANGDSVTFDTEVEFDTHFVVGVGYYVVTGGTGRFANATGCGYFEVEHLPDGTTVITWDGTLYP